MSFVFFNIIKMLNDPRAHTPNFSGEKEEENFVNNNLNFIRHSN